MDDEDDLLHYLVHWCRKERAILEVVVAKTFSDQGSQPEVMTCEMAAHYKAKIKEIDRFLADYDPPDGLLPPSNQANSFS